MNRLPPLPPAPPRGSWVVPVVMIPLGFICVAWSPFAWKHYADDGRFGPALFFGLFNLSCGIFIIGQAAMCWKARGKMIRSYAGLLDVHAAAEKLERGEPSPDDEVWMFKHDDDVHYTRIPRGCRLALFETGEPVCVLDGSSLPDYPTAISIGRAENVTIVEEEAANG